MMNVELERYRAISVHGGSTTIVTQAAGPACDGDGEVLAHKHAALFRSTSEPSLACELTAGRDSETVRAFSESLEQGLKPRLSSYLCHSTPLSAQLFLRSNEVWRGKCSGG
jgi:hypothetical protein